MWETSKNYSPLPALGRINEFFFRDIILDKYNKQKNIVVFLEENLSPEDFSTFDSAGQNVFYSLSHLKSHAQVNYYPFVETPLKALQNLPGVEVRKVEVTADGLPEDFKIERGQVIIINFNDAKENEDRSQMLQRHDSCINSIYKAILAQNENVIAIFTAKHSSWLVPSELDNNSLGRKARNLMQAVEEEPKQENQANTPENKDVPPEPVPVINLKNVIVKNTNDTLFYAGDNIVLIDNDKRTEMTTISNMVSEANYTTIEGDTMKLTLPFLSERGYWLLPSIQAEVGGKSYRFVVREVYAPYGFSYHCNNTVYVNDTKVTLSIPGFQVQRFSEEYPLKEHQFDEAYDCIGFTSPAIWSGLFVTFILALIMSVGLCMIMDIKTMDRFDDPKGKTISVNVVE